MATQTVWKSGLTCYALRLKPGEELYSSLLKYKKECGLQAPFIMTCCGSLTKATLRLAGFSAANPNNEIREFNGPFEIVSLVGTLSGDGGHLHISLSDAQGCVIGGHVIGGLYVFTTAEIVIGECSDLKFTREQDDFTGFQELAIKNNVI